MKYDHKNLVSCCGEKLALSVVSPSSDSDGNTFILLLPGGGRELGKERFQYMQRRLAEKGFLSASFDFPGVGDSTGDLKESSLEDRTQQTICVTKHLQNQFPEKEFVLCGVSMGGYVALSVVNKTPDQFNKLILHAPAAYAKEAHSVNFNEEFTAVLRQDASWQSSQSFGWLVNYPNPTLILFGLEDDLIPKGIINCYENTASDNQDTEFVGITDMEHNIWEGDNAEYYQDIILDRVINFLHNKGAN